MKTTLINLAPDFIVRGAKNLRDEVNTAKEFTADWRAYRRYCAHQDADFELNDQGAHLEAQITKDYHRVEKGLSLAAPRKPFGAAVERRLRMLLPNAQDAESAPFALYAREALDALQEWNDAAVVSDVVSPVFGGPSPELDLSVMESFFRTRKSVRNFEDTPIDIAKLTEAISLATSSPSVCNRQAARVHVFTDKSEVQNLLAHQNGNAGFRHQVPAVAVVTVDRRLFSGRSERNQRWIDGGLFAMTLVWALHGLGIGSCMLNWSMTNKQTEALRTFGVIPEYEDVVVLIACGTPAPGMRYARSPRRSIKEVSTFH